MLVNKSLLITCACKDYRKDSRIVCIENSHIVCNYNGKISHVNFGLYQGGLFTISSSKMIQPISNSFNGYAIRNDWMAIAPQNKYLAESNTARLSGPITIRVRNGPTLATVSFKAINSDCFTCAVRIRSVNNPKRYFEKCEYFSFGAESTISIDLPVCVRLVDELPEDMVNDEDDSKSA